MQDGEGRSAPRGSLAPDGDGQGTRQPSPAARRDSELTTDKGHAFYFA